MREQDHFDAELAVFQRQLEAPYLSPTFLVPFLSFLRIIR
jgi:hypothetical protein